MSEIKPTQTTEFEELSIGTTEGLQAFLRNAQLQYQHGLEKDEEMLRAGDYEYGNRLTQAFHKVRSVTSRLLVAVEGGEAVTLQDAEALQKSYDVLIATIRNTRKNESLSVSRKDEIQPSSSVKEATRIHEKQNQPETSKPVETGSVQITEPVSLKKESNTSSNDLYQTPIKPKTGSLSIGAIEEEVIDIRTNISVSDSSVQALAEGQSTERRKRRRRKKKKQKNTHSNQTNLLVAFDSGRAFLKKAQSEFPHPNMVQKMLFQELRDSVEQLELMSKKAVRGEVKQNLVEELLLHIQLVVEGIAESNEINVGNDSGQGTVPVVTERAGELFQELEKSESLSPVTFVPTSVATKRPDSTKRPIPKQLSQLSRPAEIHEVESLTEKYLTAPKYRHFINQYYTSPVAFEKIIDATITKIESTTIDHIDKWLGDVPASAFSFLKDMSVREVARFADRTFEEIQFDLKQENIKYETFAEWRDLADEMIEIVPGGEEMKFGQLFAHYMIEQAMRHGS